MLWYSPMSLPVLWQLGDDENYHCYQKWKNLCTNFYLRDERSRVYFLLVNLRKLTGTLGHRSCFLKSNSRSMTVTEVVLPLFTNEFIDKVLKSVMQLTVEFKRKFLFSLLFFGIRCYCSKFIDGENYKNIPSYERQALHDLYVSTNGDDWMYQDGDLGHWNFTNTDVNPCSSSDPWQGLNCNVNSISSDISYFYHISQILLSDFNLRGTIPESIGKYTLN